MEAAGSPFRDGITSELEILQEECLTGVAYSGNPLNRLSYERKDAQFLSSLLENPSSLCIPFLDLSPLLQKTSSGKQGRWLKLTEVQAIVGASVTTDVVLLGTKDGVGHYALAVQDGAPFTTAQENVEFSDLRRNIALLSTSEAAIIGQARALVEWHATHIFCGACGTKTVPIEGGAKRICTNTELKGGDATEKPTKPCGLKSYPQTTPAVIMLVVSPDGKRCLLGRQKIWPAGMWSTLAGFVDSTETPEEAVRREVMEEAGVEVGKVTYFGCQPWPFGGQLMVGFFAVAKSDAIKVDNNELEAADWYTPEQVQKGLDVSATSPTSFYSLTEWRLPPAIAIANRLASAWVKSCSGSKL